jgi:hypothetical protein
MGLIGFDYFEAKARETGIQISEALGVLNFDVSVFFCGDRVL